VFAARAGVVAERGNVNDRQVWPFKLSNQRFVGEIIRPAFDAL
jgi:hypothetical protein